MERPEELAPGEMECSTAEAQMPIEGTIRPVGERAGFNRETWCRLVASRPEFRRLQPRQARNPFAGATTTIQPPADAADVVVGGGPVGRVSWSMSEEPLVNVRVESAAMPLVREWAAALGGEFRPNAPDGGA
jgi:hypothetical protein